MKLIDVTTLLGVSRKSLFLGISTLLIVSCTPKGGGGGGSSALVNGHAALTLTFPSSATVISNQTSLSIAGSCEPDSAINLTGDDTQTTTCTNGNFALSITPAVDGVYSYQLTETIGDEAPSSPVSLTWTRDTQAPATPIISSPSNPLSSNASSVTMSGSCEAGSLVALSGSGVSSVTCDSGGQFTFTLNNSSDGSFHYSVSQSDPAGNVSGVRGFDWNRDATAPSAIVITSPATNPYLSSDNGFTLTGTCENAAVVNMTGAQTDSTICAGNTFSFALSQVADATYNYSLTQTDASNNTSNATNFQWTRDTAMPATPAITSPVTPYTSNATTLTITGTCTTGFAVELTGDATSSTTCASNAFSFNVTKNSDGIYLFSILQRSLTNIPSASANLSWTRDTAAPAAVTVTGPGASPYRSNTSSITLTGACETGATVYLSGASTSSTNCTASTYSFNFSTSSDATYSFTISQKDLAGNSSPNTNFSWIRDATPPLAPVITSPLSPYLSNTNSVSLTGACEAGTTVNLSGAETATANCSSGSFTFTLSQSSDGIYNYAVNQRDAANNLSPDSTLSWQRDTVVPAAPTLSNPGTNPFTSSDTNLTLSGTCENGATVALSGSDTGSVICSANSFSFTVSQSVDADYAYTFKQTDGAGNVSSALNFAWTRLSSVPPTPVLSAPTQNPMYSNQSNLVITGSCQTGNAVNLTGSSTASTTCASNSFTFTVNKTSDGTYNFNITQTNASSIVSAAASLTWTRDTVVPTAPVVSAPAISPYYSNASSVVISGTCESGATVNLSGGYTAATSCTGGSFSFTVNKSTDGTYAFTVKQADLAGNVSSGVSKTWIRDTVSPNAVTVVSPASNPFISGDSSISLSGVCEPSATVSLSGDASASTACSALGNYSVTINKSVDSTYTFTLIQTDLAGNSSNGFDFEWTRDTTIPSTPVITSPALIYTSNGSDLTITVTCDTTVSPSAAVVNLDGDVSASEVTSPSGSLSQDCTSSPVSFTIHKTVDGVYSLSITQDNPNNSLSSAATTMQWTRDTVAPDVVTINNPSVSPFTAPGNLTIAGDCESNATVNLTGSATASITCVADAFSFTINKSTDATYDFSITQTDSAGNTSAATAQQWIRDSNSVSAPTITTPAASPLTNNASSITIAGTCNDDFLVTLGGSVSANDVTSPVGSLTQICVDSSFTFVVAKSTDGSYAMNLKQSYNGVNSPLSNITWVRDTVAPTTSITAQPTDPNLKLTANFTFTKNDSTATFQCSLDGAAYATCTSPKSLSSLTNASHTLLVRAVDTAGNIGGAATYTWTQSSYKTMALYHLNNSAPTTDSSSYTQVAGYTNSLTAGGSPANDTSGKLPSSSPSSRSLGSSISYSATSNNSLKLGTDTMTIEGFFKLSTAIGTTGQYYTLVSKTGSASPDFGWEVRLRKSSTSKYALDFVGSLNGTSAGTVVSSNTFSLSTGTWYYFAVTWNLGTVNFYQGTTTASSKGTKTIGTAGSSNLAATAGALRLGANASSGTGSSLWFAGSLDEVRISQTVRTVAVPSAEFSAD